MIVFKIKFFHIHKSDYEEFYKCYQRRDICPYEEYVEYALPWLIEIELVDPESSEEEAEPEGSPFRFHKKRVKKEINI